MEKSIIRLDDLSFEYDKGKLKIPVLDHISANVQQGEIVALTGPSGSGKSTLLNLIGGLCSPISGSIIANKHPLETLNQTQLSAYRRSSLGFVFQFFNLLPTLNVYENIEFPTIFSGKIFAKKDINELINIVGLEGFEKRRIHELSGGQMQRVAIARALVMKPKIILADEPTGNLDANTSEVILKLFKQFNAKFSTTFIIATHDPSVLNYCTTQWALQDGRLI